MSFNSLEYKILNSKYLVESKVEEIFTKQKLIFSKFKEIDSLERRINSEPSWKHRDSLESSSEISLDSSEPSSEIFHKLYKEICDLLESSRENSLDPSDISFDLSGI